MERTQAARVLGVASTASADEIRSAYRRRARQLHPDTQQGDNDAMVELNAAYESLLVRDEPDWEFAAPAPPDDVGDWTDPTSDDDLDGSPNGQPVLRWFGVAIVVAGIVLTTVVFIAAIGYDWSLSP